MKIVVVGANGTIGKHVKKGFEGGDHEIITVGKTSGELQVNIENPESVAELYKKIGKFDAVVNASGDVAFTPFESIKTSDWNLSLKSKLMGQINLVQQALPYINDRGSFTLISGILSDEAIAAGTIAATVNRALEGFVQAAAYELPRGLRINVVSPGPMKDSIPLYGSFFPGFPPVDGEKVAQAFRKSALGIQTGKIYKVYE